MKSLDIEFLSRQAIPVEMGGLFQKLGKRGFPIKDSPTPRLRRTGCGNDILMNSKLMQQFATATYCDILL
jgi:hypothetical protein